MNIKVQFDCDESVFKKVCSDLRNVLSGAEEHVILEPQRSYNNYCGFYKGTQDTIENFNKIFRGYYESEQISYYEILHF